eukprot:scaffold751_cov87-Cylindrotheca_fusiformis.AAC.2
MALVRNLDLIPVKEIVQDIKIQQHDTQVEDTISPDMRPDRSMHLGDDFPVVSSLIVNRIFSLIPHGWLVDWIDDDVVSLMGHWRMVSTANFETLAQGRGFFVSWHKKLRFIVRNQDIKVDLAEKFRIFRKFD